MTYVARYILTIAVAAALLTLLLSVSASAQPYGPHAKTWRSAPDGVVKLAPGATRSLPRAATEVDCWRGGYRLRQRPTRDGYSFTTAHSRRTIIGYVKVNRDLFSFAQRPTRCFWWGS